MRDLGKLTALVSTVFTQRTNCSQQVPGGKSPLSSLLFVTLLVLVPGHDGIARADLLDGLQLHVRFENNVNDNSPNSFNGQASGDLQYTAGVIGQAAIFDGVDDQVLFPAFPDDLISDNNFSVTYWFNIPSGSLRSVLGKREICGTAPFFDIRMQSNRSMGFELSDSNSFLVVSSPATTETWHHVAFTRVGTDLRAFLDGEPVAQAVAPTSFDISNTAILGLSNSPCIGSDGTQMLAGGLDDLRIYDRLLTDEEIHSLAGMFADGFESVAVAAQ
jgi:hypothetical protein